MGDILAQLPRGSRVAVVRLRSLGDCVLTTPALEILKNARPDLRVSVVVEPPFAAVFEGNPDVDAVLGPSLREVRGWGPRLCLNLHGGTRSMRLTALSGALFRAGFAHFRGAFLQNVRIPTAQEILGLARKVHTAEHLASAVFYLGAPRCAIPRAKVFVTARGAVKEPYAVIHPMASAARKTWPAVNFIAVARRLPVAPIFIAGPGEDLRAFGEFRTILGAPLAEIKALLSRASLFIGNDSGPAHIAAAFGVPSVVLFGSSDPEIWGPWKTAAEVLAASDGIDHIAVEQVLAAADRLRVVA